MCGSQIWDWSLEFWFRERVGIRTPFPIMTISPSNKINNSNFVLCSKKKKTPIDLQLTRSNDHCMSMVVDLLPTRSHGYCLAIRHRRSATEPKPQPLQSCSWPLRAIPLCLTVVAIPLLLPLRPSSSSIAAYRSSSLLILI